MVLRRFAVLSTHMRIWSVNCKQVVRGPSGAFVFTRLSMDDDSRAGCPQTSQTQEHITKVRAALADHWRLMIRMLAEQFHIDKETIRKIVTEDLGGKKLCARFVPHALASEQREDCVTSCCNFLQMHQNDLKFFCKIITGDESWCLEASLRKVAHNNHVSGFFQFLRAHP